MIVIPTVRLAILADARTIAEMSRDFIEHGLGWSWSQSRVAHSIQDKATNVAVIHQRGCLYGFGIMHYGEDTAHLALLCVQPSQRRRGLGALLTSWLEKSALTAGIGTIRVEARADNPKAIAFYRKQGYDDTGRVPGYYRGAIDAVRFEKRLWSSNP